MQNSWFKFYGSEYLIDPKMMSLSACERSCWVTILCYASANDGYIKYLTEAQLMNSAGVTKKEWDDTVGVLKKFEEMKMITIRDVGTDNAVIEVTNWRKRQEKPAMTGYQRIKKYRDVRKDNAPEVLGVEDDNAMITMITDDNAPSSLLLSINSNSKEISSNIDNSNRDIYIYGDDFLEFWTSYPKKTGKGDAYKSWTKLKPSKRVKDEIIASVEKHKLSSQWKRNDGQYIPNPSTFLNQRRWEDEVKVEGDQRSGIIDLSKK